MIVQELMTKDPITIDVNHTVEEALGLLYESDIRHLPVLERGELRGILSDRDLKAHTMPTMAALQNPEEAQERLLVRVGAVMQGEPLFLNVEDDVREAISLMLTHKVGALPVTELGGWKLVGILSYMDVLRAVEGLFEADPDL